MKTARVMIISVILMWVSIFAQTEYPVDSLLTSTPVSKIRKIVIFPISLWQRISYSDVSFNCQFFPSCSNYSAQAIARYGLIPGFAFTADRLIRCNPFAHGYHIRSTEPIFYDDGRMVNNVPKNPLANYTGRKSAVLASGLSAILPGTGRIYAGRSWDGVFGFLTVTALANLTYRYHKDNYDTGRLFFGSLTAIFYLGELIGAYQASVAYNRW